MLEGLYYRQTELYARLDSLEGCENNPVYAEQVKEIRRELANIQSILNSAFGE